MFIATDETTGLPTIPQSVQGILKNVLVVYQPSTLSYIKLTADAAGNLKVLGASSGGGAVSIADGAVVVSNTWANIGITAFVTQEGLGSKMLLDDFVQALALEVGNPAFILTSKSLAANLHAAKNVVLDEMKQATIHVV
jgi:hypothetical protein